MKPRIDRLPDANGNWGAELFSKIFQTLVLKKAKTCSVTADYFLDFVLNKSSLAVPVRFFPPFV
jgi:hypothetical protein